MSRFEDRAVAELAFFGLLAGHRFDAEAAAQVSVKEQSSHQDKAQAFACIGEPIAGLRAGLGFDQQIRPDDPQAGCQCIREGNTRSERDATSLHAFRYQATFQPVPYQRPLTRTNLPLRKS